MGILKWTDISIKVFILCVLLPLAKSSVGDRSEIFGRCFGICLHHNCTDEEHFMMQYPKHLQLLRWDCSDECKYNCMWQTVDTFQKFGSGVPQFFGKWPFVRFIGIQEPASMIFSLLNALSHCAIFFYRAKVPSSADMFRVWHLMAATSTATWLCAAVFHTRDTPLTEKLDYFSAFALVLFNLFSLLYKVIGPGNPVLRLLPAFPLLSLYFYHIKCLINHFDYGYNMQVNISVGALNAIGWIAWSFYHRKTRPYVWKCLIVIVGLNVLLLLEIGDFAPFFWVFDAHAIWHAGTVLLNIFWYSFIIDDSLHSLSERDKEDYKKMI